MIQIEQYEGTVDDDYKSPENVSCTSLVLDPATKRLFAVFHNEENKPLEGFKVVEPEPSNKQKRSPKNGKFSRYISGVWFMPDTDYTRYDHDFDEWYTVRVSRAELKKAIENFKKAGSDSHFNKSHDGKDLSGIKTFELWIVDSYEERSPILKNSIEDLGYTKKEIPLGSVFMTAFIEDEKFFNEYILTGKLKGFSIEVFFKTLNKQNMSFKKQVDAIAEKLGVVTDGNFSVVTKKGTLKLCPKQGFSLNEKEVKEGEFEMLSGFKIVLRDGKAVDYGFSEEAPEAESGQAEAEAESKPEAEADADADAESKKPEGSQQQPLTESDVQKMVKDMLLKQKQAEADAEKAKAEQAKKEAEQAKKDKEKDDEIERLKKENERLSRRRGAPKNKKVDIEKVDTDTHRVVKIGGRERILPKNI